MWYEYYRKIQRLNVPFVVCGMNITGKYNIDCLQTLRKLVVCDINITGKYNTDCLQTLRKLVVCDINITGEYNLRSK
jgi:hypothetical protein